MRVRLLKPWKFQKVGTIYNDMPDGVANMLIKRKFAEEVRDVRNTDNTSGKVGDDHHGTRAGNANRGKKAV